MSSKTDSPTKAKGLVEFSSSSSRALAVTDRIHTEGGALVHDQCRSEIDFMVQYQGFWFAVHTDQKENGVTMRVHGIIGHLPYSYQSSFLRTNIFAVVHAASREIKGKIRVDDQQRILLIDEVFFKGQLTPKLIVSETAKVLLRLKPYLELVKALQPLTSTPFMAPDIESVASQEEMTKAPTPVPAPAVMPEPVSETEPAPTPQPVAHPVKAKAKIKIASAKPKIKMSLKPKLKMNLKPKK
ncbi:MAG: hypothetical protein HWE34_08540 [Methylocystaceae bacterium]|nr:hypothetical protein [Methylocystaceae bacterium]